MNKFLNTAVKTIAAGALAATFFGCGDDVAVNARDESKVKSTIDFTILDKADGDAIDSAKITYVINGKEIIEYTDSTGQKTIGGLPAGDYAFRVKADGYAEIIYSVGFSPLGETDVPILGDSDPFIMLHAEGVTMSGQVKITDLDGNKSNLEGAIVDLDLANPGTGEFVRTSFSKTTDADGVFSFTNLPERLSSYTVTVRSYTDEDGMLFKTGTSWSESGVKSGETKVRVEPFVLTVAAPTLTMDASNSEGIAMGDSLVLKFSEPVDTDKIVLDDIYVRNPSNDIVGTTKSWSSDKKSLTITPVGGEWGSAGTHTVYYDLTSEGGDDLNGSQNFLVDSEIPSDVSGLVYYGSSTDTDSMLIDYNTSYVYTRWSVSDDATGYRVYVKAADDDSYVLYSTISDDEDTTATISTSSVNGDYTEGDQVLVKVVATTNAGEGSLESADVLTLEDNRGPMISSISTLSEYYCVEVGGTSTYNICNNSASSDSLFLDDEAITISADVDTLVAPTLSVTNSTHLQVEWEWTSTSSANVSLYVPAGVDARSIATDNVSTPMDSVKITGLKDKAGNDIDTTYYIPIALY